MKQAAEAPSLPAAGLPEALVDDWQAGEPDVTGDLARDRRSHCEFWRRSDELLARLPKKAARGPAEAAVADAIRQQAREARERFLRRHAGAIYAELTRDSTRFVRIEELVFAAAEAIPGLTPTRPQVAAEAGCMQRDKDGLEIDQGVLLSHILGDEQAGRHLCHAMLLPRPEADALLVRLGAVGSVDLGCVKVERHGRAAYLTTRNPRYLNAEDQTTLDAMEIAVDVATLDPKTDIAVLRGGTVDHPKYRGRHEI